MTMPDNVHFIIGNDDAQIADFATKLVEKIAGPTPDAFSCDVYQETDAGADPALIIHVIRSLQSPSFLGGVKTVWLKHFSQFSEATSKSSEMGRNLRQLAAFIEKGVPETAVLIMDGPCPHEKKNALVKACETHGNLVTFNKPDKLNRNWQADMKKCIAQVAQDKGVDIRPEAIDLLIGILGTDTARIPQELEKLICYKHPDAGPVTAQHVMDVCNGQGEEFSWSYGNALGQRNLSECLRIIDTMSNQSKNADVTARSLILASANFFRQALQIQIFMSQQKLPTPVSLKKHLETASPQAKEGWKQQGSDFVTMHPYRVQMIAENATRYRPQEAIRAMTTLRNAYWQCISSSTAPRVTLENALFQIIPKA